MQSLKQTDTVRYRSHTTLFTTLIILLVSIVGIGLIAGVAVGSTASTDGGEEIWTTALGEGEDGTEATVVDGVVYVGTDDGEVLALDVDTGEELWTKELGAAVQTAPSVVDGEVYVGTASFNEDNHLYALDAANGDERWSEPTGDTVRSSPVVYDERVYVGAGTGTITAYHQENGTEDWSVDDGSSWATGVSPVTADGSVFVPIESGDLLALDAETGDELWERALDTRVRSTPSYVDGTVYVTSSSLESSGCMGACYPRELPTYTHTLHALDSSDGTEEWTFSDGVETTTGVTSPTVVGGSTDVVYFASARQTAYAVDASNGTLDQEYEVDEGLLTGTPTVADETVFLTTTRGFNDAAGVYAFDTDTGDEQWFFGDESVLASPIVSDGSVFVPTRAGVSDLTTYRAIDAGVGVSSQDAQAVQGTNGHTDAWTGTEPDEPIVVVEAELREEAIVEDFGDPDPDTFSVDVTLRNTGSETVTHTATLEIDGEETDVLEAPVEVPAYGERQVTLESAVEEPGEYDVSVDGEFVDSLLVLPQVDTVYMADAEFESDPVLAGEEVVVETTFENLGGSGGDYDVSMLVDGVEHDTKTFDIDGNGVASVTFETTIDEAGTYDVTIDGEDGSVGVDNRPVGTLDVREEATFITDGELTQHRILVNESLPFDATIRNIGDEDTIHTTVVQFIPVVGDDVGPTTVGTSTVPANGEIEDSLAVPPTEVDEVGIYTVSLSEETAEGDEELLDIGTVQVLGDPLQFRDARLVNESVNPGESIELELVYENVKSDAVSQTVTVDRDGEDVVETVELEAYETATIRIELDGFEEWGVYDLTVSDDQTDVDGHTETVYVGESDYFVPENGTIQEAVDAASPGDVIAVAGGTYNEEVVIETADLELIGFDDETPVLDGEGGTNETAFEFGAAGITVDGFEIREYGTSGIDVGWADDATIANVTLENNGELGVAGGIPGNDPDGLTIEHSVIEGHTDGALDVNRPDDVTIHGTTLKNNGGGIDVGNDAIVTNNTIINQEGSTAISTQNDALVVNNTISDVPWSGIRVNSGSTVEQNVLTVEDTGIELRGDDIEVLDNEVASGLDDLRVSGSVGHTILNNTFETGLLLEDADEQSADSLTVEDNEVGGDPLYFAADETAPSVPNDAGQIILIDVDDATVEGYTFSGVISAVQVVNGTDVQITDVQLTDGPSSNVFGDQGTDRAAVSIWDSPRAVVQDSTFASMGDHAVRLSNSPNSTVTDNELTATERTAISIHSSADVEIRDNSVFDAQSGVWIDRSDRTEIDTNHFETLNGSAIEFEQSENVSVTNNTVKDANRIVSEFFDAFAIGGGDTGSGGADTITGATVTENTVRNGSGYGILLKGSEQIEISDNNVSQNERGIGVEWVQSMDGDGVTISNNSVLVNEEVGIRLDAATNGLDNITVTDNVIQETQERGLLVESEAVDVTVTDNQFLGNTDGVRYERQSGQLDVTDNWWGDETGPSGGLEDPETGAVAEGDGDSIAEYLDEANVRFDPWIDADSPQTGTLSGTVTNSSAVAGAAVAIEYDTGFEQTTETSDSGDYELVTLEGSYNVGVEADGYSSTEESNVTITGQETTVQDVTLTPESPGSLTGTVTDSDTNDPIEGVAIALIDGGVIDGDNTDQDGTYEVDSVDPGVYEVNFAIDGYEDKRPDNIVIADGETTTLDVELNAVGLGTIAGTVTDEDTGVLVEGAPVQIYDADDRLVTDGETDAQGEYEFEMEPGTYRVIIRGGEIGYEQSDIDDVGVTADETKTLDVGLTPEGSEGIGNVSGAVTQSDGTSIAGATVELLEAGSNTEVATNTTSDTGEYRFDAEEGTYDVVVDASGYERTVIQDVVITEDETTTRDIELIPESDITVTSADVSSTAVEVGTSVTVTAAVENVGGATDDFTAELMINDVIEDDETVAVAPSETETIAFEHVFEETGDFDVAVNGFDAGSVTVTEESMEPPTVAVDDVQATQTVGTTVYANDTVEATLGITNDSAIDDLTVHLDSLNTTYGIQVDASHNAGGEWGATIDLGDAPDDGHYQLSATVTDEVGLTNNTVADETIVIDREPPSLSAAVVGIDAAGNATVEVRSDSTLSGAPNVTVEMPDDTTQELSVSAAGTHNWTGEFDVGDSGEYAVKTTGEDLAGNEETTNTSIALQTDFAIEGGTGVVLNEETGTFVEFEADSDLEGLYVALAENANAYEELADDHVAVGFLTADLDDTLSENLSSATIHVPVDVSDIDGVDDPADVTLQRYNESIDAWESVETTVETIDDSDTELDVVGDYWTAEVDQFSTYGALAVDTEPPTLVSVSPTDGDTLSEGTDQVTVEFQYEDDASGVALESIELLVDGSTVTEDANTTITSSSAKHTVAVENGESYEAAVIISDIAGNDVAFETNFDVEADGTGSSPPLPPSPSPSPSPDPDPEPNMSLIDVTIDETAIVGENVLIEPVLENVGDADGQDSVTLQIDGETVDKLSIELDKGDQTSVTFTHVFERAGEYVVSVNDTEVGTVTVTTKSDGDGDGTGESDADDTPGDTTGDGHADGPDDGDTDGGHTDDTDGSGTDDDSVPGFGVLIALATISAIAIGLARRSTNASQKD